MLSSAVTVMPAPRHPMLHILAGILPILTASCALFQQGGIQPAIALLVASATTLAILVNGMILLTAPSTDHQPPTIQSPTAALVLPFALVLILAGFSSHLTVAACIGLSIMGVICLDLGGALPALVATDDSSTLPASSASGLIACTVLSAAILALLFLVTGQFWYSTNVAGQLHNRDLALANLLCPALLISFLRTSAHISHSHSADAALGITGAAIGIILGLILPGMCLFDFLIHWWNDQAALMTSLPQVSWRLDAPVLAVGGFALVTLRLDVLRPQRWVGLLLIIVYLAYLLVGSLLRLH